MAKYHYLVCKKNWFGMKPVKICTSAEMAQKYCAKGHVILRQAIDGELESYVPEANHENK